MERRKFLQYLGLSSAALALPFQSFAYLLERDEELIPMLERIIGQPLQEDFDLARLNFKKRFPEANENNYYTQRIESQIPEIKRILKKGDSEIEGLLKKKVPAILLTAREIYASEMDDIITHPKYEQHFQDLRSIARLFHQQGKEDLRQAIRELRTEANRFKGKSISTIISELENDPKLG